MVAVTVNGRVAMAADSMWASGWDRKDSRQPKIERRGDVLFSVGPSCGLEYALWDEIEKVIAQGGEWWKKWPSYVLGAGNETVIRRLRDDDKAACVLVGWHGQIFKVWVDGSVAQSASGIETAGCGGDFAQAAAWILRKRIKDPRAIAIAAAEVACDLSAGCAPPVISEVLKKA